MIYLDNRGLKDRSRQLLTPVQTDIRRLVLVYTAVLTLMTLGSNGLQFYLDAQIDDTGGLGGMGLRSVLQAIQEFMTYINMFFGPFWSAGFLFAMLRVIRGEQPRTGDLTAGFRKFLKIFSYLGFEMLVAILLLLVITNLATTVYLMTPWGEEFYQIMEPYLSDPAILTAEGTVNLDLIPMEAMMSVMMPMLGILLALFLPIYTWLSYHFRMAMYLVMGSGMGGTAAHIVSIRLMRGHKWELVKLDLSYWWYYLLQLIIAAAGWLDIILALVGVELPIDPIILYFATLLLYCGLQLVLNLWKKAEVDCTYLCFYDAILQDAKQEK